MAALSPAVASFPTPEVGAVIVAAGRGRRFGDPDKVFREIGDRPLYLWAAVACAAVAERVVVVTRPDAVGDVQMSVAGILPPARFRVVAGGEHRQDSVMAGVREVAAAGAEIVVVQDGARPLTRPELVAAAVASARERGSGVAARPMTDTVKEADPDGRVDRTLDRARLWAVETPQVFSTATLTNALGAAETAGRSVHDDAAAVEAAGGTVWLVDASPWGPNWKVTTPDDLARVRAELRARHP